MPTKSYYDPDIAVSLEMPTDWEAAANDQFPLILMAPPEGDFRANLSFSVQVLEPPTPEHLQRLIDETRAERSGNFDGFELVTEERLMQDNFPAHLEVYHWTMDGSGVPMTQVFALILTAPEALYSLHATCLRGLESHYVPVFRDMIRSIRFIQE